MHCCVCPSRPRSHQSHLATALGLPACNFMAQKYNVSFCQHSVLIEARSFTAVYLLFSAIVRMLLSILILGVIINREAIKVQKKRCVLRDKCEIDSTCESLLSFFFLFFFLGPCTFQRRWSTIVWKLMLL